MKHYNIGYTTGVFDLFHIGHLNILRQARAYCDYLIVGVTSDELCHANKHKYPVIPLSERMDIVGAIRYVDRVVVQSDMDKLRAVKEYGAEVVFVGSDWQNTPQWIEYEKQFASVGCSVIYLPHTDGTSSTLIKSVIEKLNTE
jgi:glycerol-3-phosphate cytidylyltransferase